ncbi:MAG: hypothetical protein DI535_20975 [Citrobacter freundii]|nr:MAG: hypothetical protein DI535_20975 [Citrobacter freundii]
MKLYPLLALLPFLYSCTKETYVEHVEDEKVRQHIYDLNLQLGLGKEINTFTVDIDGKPQQVSIQAYRVKVSPSYWPAPEVNLGDSIMILYLSGNEIEFDGVDGGLLKYAEGQSLLVPASANVGGKLCAGYRKAPFIAGYTSFTYLQGSYFKFSLKDQGYVGFRFPPGFKPARGWFAIEITELAIRIKKYGYYTNTNEVSAGR